MGMLRAPAAYTLREREAKRPLIVVQSDERDVIPIGGGAAGPNPKRQRTSKVLRQREEWIRFSYSNEDTKDEERRKGWVGDRRLNVVPSAKRALCPRATPQKATIQPRTTRLPPLLQRPPRSYCLSGDRLSNHLSNGPSREKQRPLLISAIQLTDYHILLVSL
jgi:hypothetical protein